MNLLKFDVTFEGLYWLRLQLLTETIVLLILFKYDNDVPILVNAGE